jgi:hypothetical protein
LTKTATAPCPLSDNSTSLKRFGSRYFYFLPPPNEEFSPFTTNEDVAKFAKKLYRGLLGEL